MCTRVFSKWNPAHWPFFLVFPSPLVFSQQTTKCPGSLHNHLLCFSAAFGLEKITASWLVASYQFYHECASPADLLRSRNVHDPGGFWEAWWACSLKEVERVNMGQVYQAEDACVSCQRAWCIPSLSTTGRQKFQGGTAGFVEGPKTYCAKFVTCVYKQQQWVWHHTL